MYNRHERSRLKHEFWTTFGRYMSPVPSAEGMKINWVNYHTGIKDIYFRMDAGNNDAAIYISLEHKDAAVRQIHFEKLLSMESILHEAIGEAWRWESNIVIMGKENARIGKTLSDVSVFNRDHWPELISFFKPRIIGLDSFWENAKWGFE
jgi:hypothetical protein